MSPHASTDISPSSTELAAALYHGSVKDIYQDPQDREALRFYYSDAYSVFDWGRMPDELKGKGQALLFMAQDFFSLVGSPQCWRYLFSRHPQLLQHYPQMAIELTHLGMKHHLLSPSTAAQPFLKVRKVSVLRPQFDHDTARFRYYPESVKLARAALIPLEIIFRWGAPTGSSLLKRMDVKENSMFDRPMIEFTTKLESQDRLLTADEARWMSGLDHAGWLQLVQSSELLAWLLRDFFTELGITLWDGKFEFARINHPDQTTELMLVDSIGPDELRLTRQGQLLSKERLRQHYRSSAWYAEVAHAKKQAEAQGVEDWQTLCPAEPAPLPSAFKLEMEEMYFSLAQAVRRGVSRWCEVKHAQQ